MIICKLKWNGSPIYNRVLDRDGLSNMLYAAFSFHPELDIRQPAFPGCSEKFVAKNAHGNLSDNFQ